MLCPGDDLVLQRLAQIAKIVAVARHAHDQIAVLLRVLLGSAQRGRVHHVELDVVAVQPEVAAHQVDQVVQPLLIAQQVRGEFLIEQRGWFNFLRKLVYTLDGR